MATETKQPSRARFWLYSVLALSRPSAVFVLLHQVVVVHYYKNSTPLVSGPAWLDRFLLWPVLLTGMLGSPFTLSAFIVTVVGTFRRAIPRKTKVAAWIIVALSILACLYIALIPDNLMALVQ